MSKISCLIPRVSNMATFDWSSIVMAKKTSFYKEAMIFGQADKKPAKIYEVSLHPDLRKEYYDL